MTSGRRLLLVRHCQASGQLPDDPLTEVGFEQAASLAEFLFCTSKWTLWCPAHSNGPVKRLNPSPLPPV